MFRKLLLAGMTALGLALSLGMTTTADAHPPIYRHHERFVVFYRTHYSHWREYGVYSSRWEAERVAERLRCEGHSVRIDERY